MAAEDYYTEFGKFVVQDGRPAGSNTNLRVPVLLRPNKTSTHLSHSQPRFDTAVYWNFPASAVGGVGVREFCYDWIFRGEVGLNSLRIGLDFAEENGIEFHSTLRQSLEIAQWINRHARECNDHVQNFQLVCYPLHDGDGLWEPSPLRRVFVGIPGGPSYVRYQPPAGHAYVMPDLIPFSTDGGSAFGSDMRQTTLVLDRNRQPFSTNDESQIPQIELSLRFPLYFFIADWLFVFAITLSDVPVYWQSARKWLSLYHASRGGELRNAEPQPIQVSQWTDAYCGLIDSVWRSVRQPKSKL